MIPERERLQMETEEDARKLLEAQNLGKANTVLPEQTENNYSIVGDLGWSIINLRTLPSQGIFYPENTIITIRSADSAEIRHWSTLDENDLNSMDNALNRIIERCCKIRVDGILRSYNDIKEIDRFYIVFSIRELTFSKGENNIRATFDCKICKKTDTVDIRKEMISYYIPDEKLQQRFSSEEKCFHLKLKNGEELKLFLPSLGVMSFIKQYIKQKNEAKEQFDEAFIKWAPFLFKEWKTLNDSVYHNALQNSFAWGTDKISVMEWFCTSMKQTVNPIIKHKCSACGTEVSAPLSFPGGIRSLFIISDISDKLL